LLFVEFAVNDAAADPTRIERAMEGVVRQTWTQFPRTDVCFVYTLAQGDVANLQAGKISRSAEAMERVAAHYGVPSIHLGIEVARMVGEGRMIFTGALGGAIPAFSGDGTHPHRETGHPLYFAAIERAFPVLQSAGVEGARTLPAPLRKDNWEAARIIPLSDVTRTTNWQQLDAKANPLPPVYAKRLPQLWRATEAGQAITFRFNGHTFGFNGAKGPDSGMFAVSVDGGEPIKATHFDSFSREDRYRLKPWFYPGSLAPGEHSVRIELLSEAPPKAEILQKAGVTMTDPTQFAANNLYIGEIFVVGEFVDETP
jgi:hypothetical protein